MNLDILKQPEGRVIFGGQIYFHYRVRCLGRAYSHRRIITSVSATACLETDTSYQRPRVVRQLLGTAANHVPNKDPDANGDD